MPDNTPKETVDHYDEPGAVTTWWHCPSCTYWVTAKACRSLVGDGDHPREDLPLSLLRGFCPRCGWCANPVHARALAGLDVPPEGRAAYLCQTPSLRPDEETR